MGARVALWQVTKDLPPFESQKEIGWLPRKSNWDPLGMGEPTFEVNYPPPQTKRRVPFFKAPLFRLVVKKEHQIEGVSGFGVLFKGNRKGNHQLWGVRYFDTNLPSCLKYNGRGVIGFQKRSSG